MRNRLVICTELHGGAPHDNNADSRAAHLSKRGLLGPALSPTR